jgi:phosphatidylglycerol:prolipoprotein diacylglycerol transferase
VPTAVIAFDFDPYARLGDTAVRWETVGIAAALFAALVVAGVAVRSAGMRVDDLLFVVLGVVPGAVIGARLGYVLLHPTFFTESPMRILDPASGSLELTLGVVGGALTGTIVGGLIDGRPGRWLRAAAIPLLVIVGFGKLAMVLGGSGQGQPTSTEPATAYLGPGPWGSLGPAVPSVPSQALEGAATLVVLVALLVVLLIPSLRHPDGRAFLLALAAWCGVRAAVATTWRDPIVAGPLRAEQVIAAAVGVGSLLLFVGVIVRTHLARRRDADDAAALDGEAVPL